MATVRTKIDSDVNNSPESHPRWSWEEVQNFTLIGKFPDGNPRQTVFHRSFRDIGFKGDYEVKFHAFKFVLIVLTNEEDYAKIWSRKDGLFFDGCRMEIVDYLSQPRISMESPIDKFQENEVVKLVRWVKPLTGWVKLNTDGVSKGNPGPAGAGGLVRDDKGDVQFAFSHFLGWRFDVAYAEMSAVYEGLALCIERGFHHVWIEVDSAEVIELICGRKQYTYVNRRIENLVCKVREMLEQVAFKMTHVYREGNRPADHLANLACATKQQQSTVFGGDEIAFLGPLLELIRDDNMDGAYLRYKKSCVVNVNTHHHVAAAMGQYCLGPYQCSWGQPNLGTYGQPFYRCF